MSYLLKCLPTYQGLLYTKQNQPLMTSTTPNGFMIGQLTIEIKGVSKRPRTLKHPVLLTYIFRTLASLATGHCETNHI